MTLQSEDFVHSAGAEPHRERTKAILRRHPEIRQLIGKNPASFWWVMGVVSLQVLIAALVRDASWWIVVGAAYLVGAFANHALFVLIHECAHKLVLRKRVPNLVTAIVANLPLFVPSAVSFTKYHLKHHAFQGVYELDADLPHRWEARLIGHSSLGKMLWLAFFPFFYMTRPLRLKEVPLFDRWTVANAVVQFSFDIAVFVILGPKALVYLALSLVFAIGLHPLGARWIQRHTVMDDGSQETYSYYGALNRVAFNVGFHNEHHDFPSVPWNRLPEIRRLAPEVYDRQLWHRSWTGLLLRFLSDKDLSLYSRVVRSDRGKVGLSDEVEPDLDAMADDQRKAV